MVVGRFDFAFATGSLRGEVWIWLERVKVRLEWWRGCGSFGVSVGFGGCVRTPALSIR